MWPSISIIVPVYNVEQYISECITSIISQKYDGEIECIIIDDCGTDNSMAIVEEKISNYYGTIKFVILRHQQNKGLSAARNTGIKAASGEYIAFVDSDDYLFPDSIALLASLVVKYPGVNIVQGDTTVHCPKPNSTFLAISPSRFPEYSENKGWCATEFINHIPAPVWSKLINRQFILSHQLFFVEGYLHEDEIWRVMVSRVVKTCAFQFQSVYCYRNNNSESIMHQRDQTKSYIGYLRLIEEMTTNFNWDNYHSEKKFAISYLHFRRKASYWPMIHNRKQVRYSIKELYIRTSHAKCPSILKFMTLYLRLPVFIGNFYPVMLIYNSFLKYVCKRNHQYK